MPSLLPISGSSYLAFSNAGLLIGGASRNTAGKLGKRAHIAALDLHIVTSVGRGLCCTNIDLRRRRPPLRPLVLRLKEKNWKIPRRQ